MNARDVVQGPAQRPAEAGGIVGALALLVAHLLGLDDPDVIVSLAVVFGFVPTGITWIVTLVRGSRQG